MLLSPHTPTYSAVAKRLWLHLDKRQKVVQHPRGFALLRLLGEIKSYADTKGDTVELGLRDGDLRVPMVNKMDTGPVLRAARPVRYCLHTGTTCLTCSGIHDIMMPFAI